MSPAKRPFNFVDLVSRTVSLQTSVPKAEGALRVVCLSDTHLSHEWLTIPDGDIILHAGDILLGDRGLGRGAEKLQAFSRWLGRQDHNYKVVVAGNHDRTLENVGKEKASMLLDSATYLQHSSTFVGPHQLHVWGSPTSRRGSSMNRAFQLEASSSDLAHVYAQVPPDIDILVTHDSPFGLTGNLKGCEVLEAACSRLRPLIHVCGHLHHAYGAVFRDNGGVVICAAVVNSMYAPVRPALVFDWHPSLRSRQGQPSLKSAV